MRTICTNPECEMFEKEVYWKAGRGMQLKFVTCEECGGPMKSPPRKSPRLIKRPYVRGMLIIETIHGGGERFSYDIRERVNIYIAEDGSSIHFPRPFIGYTHTPVTFILCRHDQGVPKESPGGHGEGLFLALMCKGYYESPIQIKQDITYGGYYYYEQCAHCEDLVSTCRSKKRWIPITVYEKLVKKGEEHLKGELHK